MKFLTLKTALILKFFFACSLLADSTKTQPLESKLWTGDEIGQNGFSLKPDKTFYYKLVNKLGQATQLKIHAFFPKDHKPENKTPAILFFHGGGWYGGTPDQVYDQLKKFYDHVGGFGNLLSMGQAGHLSHEDTKKSLTLLAKEVYPRLKELGKPTSIAAA